jgi:hypothetical protein
MAGYTVFLDSFEEHAEVFGVSAEQAFQLILDRTDHTHEWERRDDAFWLILRDRNPMPRPKNWPEQVTWGGPQEFASTLKSDEAARDELRELIFSGVLKSWRALPDNAFLALQQSVMARMEEDARKFQEHERLMEERMQTAGASYLRVVG